MTPDELLSLRLPNELGRVIAAIEEDLAAGRSPVPLLRGLSVLNSLALVDVVIGPKAPGGPEMIQAALSVMAPASTITGVGSMNLSLSATSDGLKSSFAGSIILTSLQS